MKTKHYIEILFLLLLLFGVFISNYHYFTDIFRGVVQMYKTPEMPPYRKLEVQTLTFSPDSKTILVGYHTSDYNLLARLYDVDTEDILYEFPEKKIEAYGTGIYFTAFFLDGKRFLIGSGSYFKVIDFETKDVLVTVESPFGTYFTSVSLTPLDENVLTTYNNKYAELWNAKTGEKLRVFSKIQGNGYAFITTDEKFLLTPSGSRTSTIWDYSSERKIHSIQNSWCMGNGFFSPFSPNNEMFATVSRGESLEKFEQVKIWDTLSAQLVSSITTKQVARTAIFSADSQSILIGCPGYIAFHDVLSASPIITFNNSKYYDGESEYCSGEIALSANEKFVAGAMYDNSIKIWDAKTGEEIKTLPVSLEK